MFCLKHSYKQFFHKILFQGNSKQNTTAGGDKMTEHAKQMQEREMMTLGMAFMGFLMGVGAILGVWFLSGFLQTLSIMMG